MGIYRNAEVLKIKAQRILEDHLWNTVSAIYQGRTVCYYSAPANLPQWARNLYFMKMNQNYKKINQK